jgi:hypothetical protein
MKLLKRIFPAKPVKQAIACLDELRPLFESNGAHFGWLAFDDIRNTVRTAFLNDPDAVCRVAQKPDYDPRIACLRSVATVARHDLVSGREHLFHDRLTMQGQGKRAIYRIALTELVRLGALTAEAQTKGCQELDEDTGTSTSLNRAEDDRIEREEWLRQRAEANERLRIYNEKCQREEKALRKRVLDDLKAIARGEKQRLDPEAVEAAKEIMERKGVNNPGMAERHPEIVKPWLALIDELSAEKLENAKATQDLLSELLYPETLEDVQELQWWVVNRLVKMMPGEKPDPEYTQAVQSLKEIRAEIEARDRRRKQQEDEVWQQKRQQEEERRKELDKIAEEIIKSHPRNMALTAYEKLSVYARLRSKFDHLPEG